VGSGEGIRKFEARKFDYTATDEDLTEADYANHTDYQMFPSFAV
jgi:hypothetical protein